MYATPARLKEWAATGNPHYGSPANISRLKREQAAARKVLRRILKAGYSVRVHDGEDLHPITSKESEAWSAMGETDADRLYVFDTRAPLPGKVGHVVGSIYIVWGNDGEELVADYSWRESYPGSQAIIGQLAA